MPVMAMFDRATAGRRVGCRHQFRSYDPQRLAMSHFGTNRRTFLQSALAGCTLGVESPLIAPIAGVAQHSAQDDARSGGEAMQVTLTVNMQQRSLVIDTRTTLLDALREHICLTGT